MMVSPRTEYTERVNGNPRENTETPMSKKSSNKTGTPVTSNTPANAATQTIQAKGAKVKIAKAKKVPAIVSKESAASAVATKPEKAKTEKTTKSVGPSRNRSIDTFEGVRMGIMAYQNHTFTIQDKRKMSDEELCADWQKQFPNAVKFNTGHVAGARRDFNNGRHGKGQVAPKVSVPEYKDGKPMGVALNKKGKATAKSTTDAPLAKAS
jgi:hypothetical protein